ncbi:hypothetical protein BGX27_001897 [Mortierella sp. AM989]|nr:hypothetical protein BGX27_001897 [Mortierella sp. AM989]
MVSFMRFEKRTKALFLSYGKDWGLVFIVLAAFSYIDTFEPFHRQFSVKDTTIQHPFAKKETVPVWLAGVLAFILPGALIVLIAIFKKKSYTDMHNGLLGLFLAQALVLIVTDSIKITVGRPRPDFLDRCMNIYDTAAGGIPLNLLDDPPNQLSNSSMCQRSDLLKDGFKSFPSGHSSFSFGGLGYLSMYLAGKLHLFDERGHIYKSLVVLTPLILAALIATSRVDDYRHHWHDVTVGAIIGMVFAVFSYRQYYPSLAAPKSGTPFSPRAFGESLTSTLLPLRNDPDDDQPENTTHTHDTHPFLGNSRQPSFQRNGTVDSIPSTNHHEMSTTNSGFRSSSSYDPVTSFEQARQQQSGQRSNDNNFMAPLS